MSAPQLSILMSTKNHSEWLDSCISAILKQTFKDFEFLIFDDGSTDTTPNILEKWSKLDKRILIIPVGRGESVMEKYMYLASFAKGEFLWFVASDDYVHDVNFLKKGFFYITNNKKIAGFFSNARRVLASSDQWDGLWGWVGIARLLKPNLAINKYLNGSLVIAGAACIIKKKYFFLYGGYKKEVGHLGDLLNNLLLAHNYGLFFLGCTSVTVRVFKQGTNYGSRGSLLNNLEKLAYFEYFLRHELNKLSISGDWLGWQSKILACILGQFTNQSLNIKIFISEGVDRYKKNLSTLDIELKNDFNLKQKIYQRMHPNFLFRMQQRFVRSVLKRMDFLSNTF